MTTMKSILILPLALLTSCASPSDPGAGPQAPRGDTQSDAKRKMIGLQEKFDRFDYDGNAELTRSEILNGIRDEGIPGITSAEIDQLFASYDRDRNGAISIPEVNAAEAAQQ